MDYNGKGARANATTSSIRTPGKNIGVSAGSGNFDSFMIGPATTRIDALKLAVFKQPQGINISLFDATNASH